MSVSLTFTTSGTTGEPKQVTHTLEAMMANARAFNEAVGFCASTRMYHCLPQTHMAGVLNTILCPTLAGGRVIFRPTFSAATAARFWPYLLESEANTVWVTPTIAAMLLRLNREDLAETQRYGLRLRHVFCGTAPLPMATRVAWLDTYGVPLQESYGTSEHMLVSVQSHRQARALEDNAGGLLPGLEAETAPNGELVISGTPTGDIGAYKDGRLTITGRLKDLIIRGGFNVSPSEVEETIRKFPGVSDVAVVGEFDEFWGQRIVAFIEGGEPKEITKHCCKVLPKSHWPDRVEIVDKLPRNEMGKVRKADLR